MACTLVPFEYRLLYGVLTREGMRLSEALGLCWRHLDPTHGTVRLDVNKTGEPRLWALSEDVARALSRLEKDQSPDAHVLLRGSDKHANGSAPGYALLACIVRSSSSARQAVARFACTTCGQRSSR